MKVRALRANEMYKASAISAVAFEWGMDYLKEKAEQEAMTDAEIAEKEKIEIPEDPMPGELFSRKIWAAMDDEENTVYGTVTVPVYTVRFDGHPCVMGGIGGVSTLPPYRRCGAIRECMRTALKDMNENGFEFSYLYPFSYAYYRKFGYENSAEVRQWDVKFTGLKKYGAPGSVEMLLPGSDFSVLTELYNKKYADYNLSVIRREFDGELKEKSLLEDKRYIYVWKNSSGEPRGFMIFRNNGGVMDCSNSFGNRGGFLALDAEAYMGLFDFAQTFAPNYHTIRFSASASVDLRSIINEENNVESKIFSGGMARVVNVEKVLEKCRCKGSGSIVIAVTDPMAPWNEGSWKLTFGAENSVEATDEAPDIETDINTFTALICGFVDEENFELLRNFKVNNGEAPISSVFYRKKSAVLDLF